MTVMFKCRKPGCPDRRPSMLYKGRAYCPEHYREMLEGEFCSLYGKWISYLQPEERLRSLMGRMLEEVWQEEGGMLTKARIRDRAYNFRKMSETFTFEITRHPGAFKNGMVESRVVQSWRTDVTEGVVSFVSVRDWQPGDVD